MSRCSFRDFGVTPDQAVYKAWRRAERVLREAEAKARDLWDEYLRRQAVATIVRAQLAFLIVRLGFIPDPTGRKPRAWTGRRFATGFIASTPTGPPGSRIGSDPADAPASARVNRRS